MEQNHYQTLRECCNCFWIYIECKAWEWIKYL